MKLTWLSLGRGEARVMAKRKTTDKKVNSTYYSLFKKREREREREMLFLTKGKKARKPRS